MQQRQHLNSVDELQTLLKQRKLLQQFAISRLGVFGSFARNEPAHDIDLLIEDEMSLETALHVRIRKKQGLNLAKITENDMLKNEQKKPL
jgi:predicted nucleotidyltransferase